MPLFGVSTVRFAPSKKHIQTMSEAYCKLTAFGQGKQKLAHLCGRLKLTLLA